MPIKPYVCKLLGEDFLCLAILDCVEQKDFDSIIEMIEMHRKLVKIEKKANQVADASQICASTGCTNCLTTGETNEHMG